LIVTILFDPRLWLAVVLWTAAVTLGGYWKGGKDNEADHITAQLKQERAARDTEQELRRMQNRDTSAYITRTYKQQERANALPPIVLIEDCAVPAAVGRVLNDAQRGMSADAGTGPDPGAAAETVDSTCAAELNICKRNYAEVAIPNAAQLAEIQRQWESVRKLINKPEK
jgi:hypothetical protein